MVPMLRVPMDVTEESVALSTKLNVHNMRARPKSLAFPP